MEIHFDCPKCNRPMAGEDALLNELVNCPDCGHPFTPQVRPAKPELMEIESLKLEFARTKAQLGKERIRTAQVASLRGQGKRLIALSVFFALAAVLFLMAAVCAAAGGDDSMRLLIYAVAALVIAFWLYLVGQLVHIRACLEK